MKTIKIGNRSEPFFAEQGNARYVLEEGKVVDSGMLGIKAWGTAEGRKLDIDGRVVATDKAVSFGAEGAPSSAVSISVGQTGKVLSGSLGLELHGNDHRVESAGRIDGDYVGVLATGIDLAIVNSGEIDGGNIGISVFGSTNIVNKGTISGVNGIVVGMAEGSENSVIRNSGTIIGSEHSIYASSPALRVVNSGTLEGDVFLGDGADTFVFIKGVVDGEVLGGGGNDTYVVRKGGLDIREAADDGSDLVKTSVSFTLGDNIERLYLTGKKDIDGTAGDADAQLLGNSGRNTLRGGAGADELNGGRGNDVLYGGAAADSFYFNRGAGRDVVADYEPGLDSFNLMDLNAPDTFAELIEGHAREKGGDVWLTLGKDTIVLRDTALADLQESDFKLHGFSD